MTGRENLTGGAWLLADLSLNIWALGIVKAIGLDYPPAQLVFLRAAVGLVLIAPFAAGQWRALRQLDDLALHAFRVGLSAVTLAASFFAIARVPMATFTAVNFTRPLVMMAMAAVFLGEAVPRRRWAYAAVALLGVVIAVNPGALPWSPGVPALAVTVLAGSGAIIVTRRLRAAPRVVMMLFYTAGLTVLTAPFALAGWVPLAPGHTLPLLAIGVFAQAAQLCFLRAHALGEASFLAILSYLSLVMSAGVGFFVFGEVPTWSLGAGSALVILAALAMTRDGAAGRAFPPPGRG